MFRKLLPRRRLSQNIRRPGLRLTNLEERCVPAGFAVNSILDNGVGNTLRVQIAAANAAPGADTITFDSGVFGSPQLITLASVEIAITADLIIDGPVAALTISGAKASRIFNVAAATPLTVSFDDLTIINGLHATGSGGAVAGGDDSINLTRCVLSGNTASSGLGGAVNVDAGGQIMAVDCVFSGNKANNGGALAAGGPGAVDGKIIIQRCTVSGNSVSFDGGGLMNDGYILVADSTISGNTSSGAASGGGGIRQAGQFGTPAVIIRNSTLSGNSAAGSGGALRLFNSTGPLTIQNSTIVGNIASGANAGGIARDGGTSAITIVSSIVSQNTNAASPDLFSTGTITVNASLIGSKNGVTTFTADTFTNTNIGVDPLLGSLQNNGGPALTHAPSITSKAINNGSNPAGLTNDQRGIVFVRASAGGTDIGAVEVDQLVVTNTNDAGIGSLRQAIIVANGLAGADTITFDPAAFASVQMITLTSGELGITESVTITGPSAGVTISGNKASRIFNTSGAPAATPITLTDLTLTDGLADSGAAILITDESLTFDHGTITGNLNNGVFTPNIKGGGIAVVGAGTLVVSRSTISNNGGFGFTDGGGVAAATGGSLLILDSTLTNNTGSTGGGVVFQGTVGSGGLKIRNSTLDGNRGGFNGGAIGLHAFSGTLTVQNCTITNNTANASGGGIGRNDGSASGLVLVESSIVFNNTATNTVNEDLYSTGTITVNTSLIGSKTGVTTFIGDTFTNANIGVDPVLGSLQNNGGPTQTHLPGITSKAIDNGSNPAGLTTDQRGAGFVRVSAVATDIGAVELNQFIVTNTSNSGAGSLRQAIIVANALAGADTITFDPIVFATAKTITLTSGELAITESVTLTGPTVGVTVSGNNAGRIFTIDTVSGNQAVAFSKLTLTQGKLAGTSLADEGGAISLANDFLTLSDCTLTGNSAFEGGAIDTLSGVGGSVTLIRCVLTNNTGASRGGAINFDQNNFSLTMIDSAISGNSAGQGGAFRLEQASLNISGSTISGNTTGTHGGAFIFNGLPGVGGLKIVNSTLSGNSASGKGGAIYFSATAGTMVVQNSTITQNSANTSGGAIHVFFAGDITIESSIVYGNNAPSGPQILTPDTVIANTSLIGSTAGVTGTFTGDTFTNANLGVNPLLGPLANNGGPTQTHALLAGSPAFGNGSNPAGLTTDQRGAGFARPLLGGIDIGAFESKLAPVVTSVVVNGGAVQRSRVTSVTVAFDSVVTFSGSPVSTFSLKRQSDNALPLLSAAVTNGAVTSVTLTFLAGPAVDSASLADGRYTLSVDGSQVSVAGVFGDNFVMVGDPTLGPKLFRLFGDADGDGTVANNDFNLFRSSFGGTDNLFDFDNDGSVSGSDFNRFRNQFGSSI